MEKLLIIDHHVYSKNLNTKTKKGLIEEAVDFIKSLNPNDKVALLYHRDGDGVCSAFLIHKILDKLKIPVIMKKGYSSLGDYSLAHIPEKVTTAISCDLSLDKKIDEKLDYCVHLNSRFLNIENPFHYSATILSYKIFSNFIDNNKYDWALLGALCDCGEDIQHDMLKKIFSYYGKEKSKKFEDIITLCSRVYSTNIALEAMLLSEDLEDILNGENLMSNKLIKEYERLSKIRENLLRDVEESIQTGNPIGNVEDIITYDFKENKAIFCELKSKEFLSEVADEVSKKRKNDFVCVFGFGDCCEIKFRCISKKIKVNEIATKIAEKFGGEGGGHAEAAGAKINIDKNRKQEIIKYIIEEIS
jgi:single-stranded DNA-specific DHH superfamily exonuclease